MHTNYKQLSLLLPFDLRSELLTLSECGDFCAASEILQDLSDIPGLR